MGITYPVALDSGYAVWEAFANHYWPALYLVDATGRIRHHQFGEGNYRQTETEIRRLLAEVGGEPVRQPFVSVTGKGLEAAADWDDLASGETYLGFARTSNFDSLQRMERSLPVDYAVPGRLRLNRWALSGNWTVESEAAVVNAPGGRIAFRFQARDLHLVMGPISRGVPAPFRIRLDGQPPGSAHGDDVDGQGNGIVADQRLYQLIRQQEPVVDRQFEIEFLSAGVQALVFTFG
jgi:hypothetical protein